MFVLRVLDGMFDAPWVWQPTASIGAPNFLIALMMSLVC